MYSISKTVDGQNYVATAGMSADGMIMTLNNVPANKVNYSTKYKFYYSEFLVNEQQIWVTLFGKKINIAIADSMLSEEEFLNRYAKRAYSWFVMILIIIATVLLPSTGTLILVTSITKEVSRTFMYGMISLACFGFILSTLYPVDWIKRRRIKGLLCVLFAMLGMIVYYLLPIIPQLL